MSERIMLAEKLLKDAFNAGEYYKKHIAAKNYRLEHSYRVANIGRQIAIKEGLDVEALTISCLLHDISYKNTFRNNEDILNHGRLSAKMVRPFLSKLGFDERILGEMCFGIAIHVDDKADFEGERTPFAMSVGEADNIDRFDAYRIYEGLEWQKYSSISAEEKEKHLDDVFRRLDERAKERFSTKTAQELWEDRIDMQIRFYKRLKDQIAMGKGISV